MEGGEGKWGRWLRDGDRESGAEDEGFLPQNGGRCPGSQLEGFLYSWLLDGNLEWVMELCQGSGFCIHRALNDLRCPE